MKTPALSGWALPENWRKGMRPQGKNGNGIAKAEVQDKSSRGGNSDGHGKAVRRPSNGSGGNCHNQAETSNGSAVTNSDNGLDQRIEGMEKTVGTAFYRKILREYERDQPTLIRDAAEKRKVLQMLSLDC